MNEHQKEKRPSKASNGAGKAVPRAIVPTQWRRNYRRLIRLRAALLKQVSEIGDAQSRCFGERLAMAAAATLDRVLALSLFSTERDALIEVEAALLRIRQGTYGVCERSGAVILPSRLDLIPWARFTAEVQTQAEKDAADLQALPAAAPPKPRRLPG
jgi:RNA polymerase-binding transcription factor DksA